MTIGSVFRLAPLALLLAAPCALAGEPGITTSYGIDFVTVGDVGNAPYAGGGDYGRPESVGRGTVGYEYRIGLTEVTTGQWLEFVNAYAPMSQGTPWERLGSHFWGAERTLFPDEHGNLFALRDDIANAADLPVYGVTWRQAAMFCNWLHNDKATTVEAISSGVYDVSTFGRNENNTFTDQREHAPGARFWIPTLDEQYKAFYYDPDRYAEGEGGWWQHTGASDALPIIGLPGEGGETNAGLNSGASPDDPEHWTNFPVGSYAEVRSPWGLFDTSGGASEWNEEAMLTDNGELFARGVKGTNPFDSSAVDDFLHALADAAEFDGGEAPTLGGVFYGLRLAAEVPTPGSGCVFLCSISFLKRRRCHE